MTDLTVWNTYIGEHVSSSKCYCCAIESITPANHHRGHIIAKSKGGPSSTQNLRPVCMSCNLRMGNRDMRDFARDNNYNSNIVKEPTIILPQNIIHTERKECGQCKKKFTPLTLSRYDGVHCGRCFGKLYPALSENYCLNQPKPESNEPTIP